MDTSDEREIDKVTIDGYSHYVTINDKTLRGETTVSKDLYDGEEIDYVQLLTRFLKTRDDFGKYSIALAYIEEGLELLSDLPLHEYNYEYAENKLAQFNNLMIDTRKKDPYSKDYVPVKGCYEENQNDEEI